GIPTSSETEAGGPARRPTPRPERDVELPPCGLYRTTEAIGPVPADRLVYFHDHGDPGPGIYLPVAWRKNRAVFAEQGVTLPDPSLARTLRPLLAEGLYRVEQIFTCCERNCRTFERD